MSSESSRPDRSPSNPQGKWVVVGMLGFGVLMVGALWVYWELYTRPFRPLQYAIAKKFPDSSPQAIGGRYKSHRQGSPNTLRIIVRISLKEFDPVADTARAEARALELARIADNIGMLEQYEQLEVYLIQRVPEHASKQWSESRPVGEWKRMLTDSAYP